MSFVEPNLGASKPDCFIPLNSLVCQAPSVTVTTQRLDENGKWTHLEPGIIQVEIHHPIFHIALIFPQFIPAVEHISAGYDMTFSHRKVEDDRGQVVSGYTEKQMRIMSAVMAHGKPEMNTARTRRLRMGLGWRTK